MAVICSINERGYPVAVRSSRVIDACIILNQYADYIEVAMVAGLMERDPATIVSCIYIGSL